MHYCRVANEQLVAITFNYSLKWMITSEKERMRALGFVCMRTVHVNVSVVIHER